MESSTLSPTTPTSPMTRSDSTEPSHQQSGERLPRTPYDGGPLKPSGSDERTSAGPAGGRSPLPFATPTMHNPSHGRLRGRMTPRKDDRPLRPPPPPPHHLPRPPKTITGAGDHNPAWPLSQPMLSMYPDPQMIASQTQEPTVRTCRITVSQYHNRSPFISHRHLCKPCSGGNAMDHEDGGNALRPDCNFGTTRTWM